MKATHPPHAANGSPAAPPPHPHAHVNAYAAPFHPQAHHPQYPPQHHPQHPYPHPHGHVDGLGPPRGAPPHHEYRPKTEYPDQGPDHANAEMPPPPYKPGPGMPLQPHARPYPAPAFVPGMMAPQMRGPPGYHRMRGPPRGAPSGAMPPQNYGPPRGGLNPRGQPFYMPSPYGMIPPQQPFMGPPGGPVPGYPPGHGMGMGMGHMGPPPVRSSHPPPPQREKRILEIVDPKTNKHIEIPTSTKASSTSTPATSTAPSTPSQAVETSAAPSPVKKMETPVVAPEPAPPQPVSKPAGESDAAKEMRAKVLAALGKKNDATPASPVKAAPAPVVASPIKAPKPAPVAQEVAKSPKKTATSPKKAATPTPTPLSPIATKKTAAASPKKQSPAKQPAAASVNSVVVREHGKLVYTVESLLRFRALYTELPTDDADLKWPAMDIQVDTSTRSRGGGGRGGGAGWERSGSDKPGLNRQSSRGGGGGKEWSRSQEPPRQSSERGGRGGGRGGRGGGRGGRGQPEPLFDGPVKPLERTDNRWIPVKATSNIEAAKKKVNSIMNKMTREKFDKLAAQITEIDMESLEMLQSVITILFDKALGEPHFCDMYADLCVHLEQNWQVWSFLKVVANDDDGKFYWTTMAESDSEVVGPFDAMDDALASAASDEFEPVPAPAAMALAEVRVRGSKFLKLWTHDGLFYWSGQLLEDLREAEQVLNGPFESHDVAQRVAIKECSFKRILLNSCQEEFMKDNIYEELDEKFASDKASGALEPAAIAEYEEKRLITKARMLGNIRFIGELYRKGMLRENIMHECVMKLMGVKVGNDTLEPVHPQHAPDEESIESLAKLLATIGRDLDKKNTGAMNMYFAYLDRKLVKDKRLSSRIMFMIRDTIELRENNWQPRRKELKSKSLDEIRREAEREQRAPPASAPGGSGASNNNTNRPDSFRRSASSRDGGGGGGSGFNQRGGDRATIAQTYHSQSMSSRSSGPNKMQQQVLGRSTPRDDSVKTGPQGRPATFGRRTAPPPATSPAVLTKKPSGSGTPRKEKDAKPVEQLSDEDKEKIAKQAKALADEYVSIKDLAEAERCYADVVKQFPSHAVDVARAAATAVLLASAEAKDEPRLAMYELLEKLSVDKALLPFDGIRVGIQEMLAFGANNWCDVPKFHEHLASFVLRFALRCEATGVTLDWLLGAALQGVEADVYDELVQGDFLAAFAGTVLQRWSEHSAAQAFAQLRATHVSLLAVLPDYKRGAGDVQAWADKYKLGDALGLAPAIAFANYWAACKDFGKTVAWFDNAIDESVKKDPVFAALASAFVLDSVPSGELPGEDEGMLVTGVCGSLESQTRLVATLFQTRGVDPEHAASFKAMLSHLVKDLRALPGGAFAKWLELKSDNSVGRKRALAAYGDFVDELAKVK